MTSWWTAAAGAIVVMAALGNGSKLLMPNLVQERRISSSAPVHSSDKTMADVALYDSRRQAVAYLGADDSRTVYLWSGEPVAYLVDESIYGFNGRHLGWYENGVILDHDGNVVASPAIAFRKPVQAAPARGLKGVTPSKGPTQSTPVKPTLASSWSDLSARDFFLPN